MNFDSVQLIVFPKQLTSLLLPLIPSPPTALRPFPSKQQCQMLTLRPRKPQTPIPQCTVAPTMRILDLSAPPPHLSSCCFLTQLPHHHLPGVPTPPLTRLPHITIRQASLHHNPPNFPTSPPTRLLHTTTHQASPHHYPPGFPTSPPTKLPHITSHQVSPHHYPPSFPTSPPTRLLHTTTHQASPHYTTLPHHDYQVVIL